MLPMFQKAALPRTMLLTFMAIDPTATEPGVSADTIPRDQSTARYGPVSALGRGMQVGSISNDSRRTVDRLSPTG